MELENIKKLMGALKKHDVNVWKHSVFVMKFSHEIIKSLKLNNGEAKNILLGSLLHDIGKLHVSKGILNKQGPLNQREWAEIKKHPAYGASIITQHNISKDILPLVLYHHERWDGQGYYGLKGNDICYGARIIALADSIEAMSSERPYQQAKNTKKILRELLANKGYQFEPHLINVVLQIQSNEKREIATFKQINNLISTKEKVLKKIIERSKTIKQNIIY